MTVNGYPSSYKSDSDNAISRGKNLKKNYDFFSFWDLKRKKSFFDILAFFFIKFACGLSIRSIGDYFFAEKFESLCKKWMKYHRNYGHLEKPKRKYTYINRTRWNLNFFFLSTKDQTYESWTDTKHLRSMTSNVIIPFRVEIINKWQIGMMKREINFWWNWQFLADLLALIIINWKRKTEAVRSTNNN